jgi:hypothetical protein
LSQSAYRIPHRMAQDPDQASVVRVGIGSSGPIGSHLMPQGLAAAGILLEAKSIYW